MSPAQPEAWSVALTGPGCLEFNHAPLSRPAAGEILVEVLGCTLCGSDLHTFTGRRSGPLPCVLGHEIVGRVVAFGPEADGRSWQDLNDEVIHVGDRIVWAVVASCGHCDRCRRGLPQKCRTGIKYGHAVAEPGHPPLGGLATHCLLLAGTAVVRLPESLPLEVACPAGCATATVAAAIEPAGDLRERTVVIFGLGMLGLTAAAMATSRGAACVIGVDPNPKRRQLAAAFGVDHGCPPAELPALLGDAAAGGDAVDLVLEMSGSPAAAAAAIATCGIGGAIHLIGSVFPAGTIAVDPEQVVRRQLTIRGVHNYGPGHLATAVRFLAANANRYPFASLVTAWYPLAQAAEAFAAAADDGHIRVGVRPRGSAEAG